VIVFLKIGLIVKKAELENTEKMKKILKLFSGKNYQ